MTTAGVEWLSPDDELAPFQSLARGIRGLPPDLRGESLDVAG